MPNPTISDVHVNKPLTNLSVAYIQDQNNFIASKVFPNMPVSMKSDLYYKFNKEDFLTSQMEERAPGDESAGSGYRLSTDNYFCRVFALHKDVPDQVRANSDTVLQPDREAVEFLTQNALIKRELDWASAYFTTGVWTNQVAGQAGASNMGGGFSQYWNLAASTPIEDIRFAIKAVHKLNGIKPDILVLGASAWYALQDNPDLIDRVRRLVLQAVENERAGPAILSIIVQCFAAAKVDIRDFRAVCADRLGLIGVLDAGGCEPTGAVPGVHRPGRDGRGGARRRSRRSWSS
jgi:hypothetical protein